MSIRVTKLSFLIASFYWAHEIKKKLNASFLSERTKTLQRRLSNMLLGQILCVVVLLLFPVFVVHPFLVYSGGTSSPTIIFCTTALLSLLPVLSPVLVTASISNTSFFSSKISKMCVF
ncbi:hypothetical protein Y032_0037g3483 [Ancylostoma ceylanicum]|uniref:Uncharacterized protein n=1 Tax=Ancylostoma ceylanicum TaxID=53326 RepID=A0A016ULH3_9BILA|nr:hypothetical protein Y032_0037g3483 [Ancylostoma ceylanicum]